MTSKEYLLNFIKYSAGSLAVFVGINLYINDFGLFGDRDSIRIWTDEKTTKHLLSHKYIPDNFDSVLIGSSVSANMDTRKIENHKLYNLSMNSGNITELKFAVDKVLENGVVKNLIICLYPYLTKNSGIKGRQIDEKEYWGSLFSLIPIRMYLRRVKNEIYPEKDIFHSSEWGFNDSNVLKRNIKFIDFVNRRKRNPRIDINVDSVATEELKEVIEYAHDKGINVIAYYYPIYYEYLDAFKSIGAWEAYQSSMDALFSDDDVVLDLNLPEYDYITHNYDSYSDGHLSDSGAEEVLKVLNKSLNSK